jgi:hypothetical protein
VHSQLLRAPHVLLEAFSPAWCCSPQYHRRLCDYLNTYDKAFLVGADNVGSKQMSDIRAVRWGLQAWAWLPDQRKSAAAASNTANSS